MIAIDLKTLNKCFRARINLRKNRDKIKKNNLYNKFENEEIKIFKLSLNQLLKINNSKTIQNVLTKISIYEYLKKIKKN